ncbi:MAG: hypothetical protein HYX68_02745 [Planctomycetes bacterium]|nr:hypothetical protein [Planctomycetota bacterium]
MKDQATPEGEAAPVRRTLYHYTSAQGCEQIVSSQMLKPSLAASNPRDVRYGDGQYLSDIAPETRTPGQLAYALLHDPRGWRRFTHFVEIDVTGLNATEGRPGVFVIPNTEGLDLTGRIVRFGEVAGNPATS